MKHDTPIRHTVAAEVRAALGRAGRTAASLADEAGIDRNTLSRKLRAKTSFTVDELVQVATALDVDVAALLAPAVPSRIAA